MLACVLQVRVRARSCVRVCVILGHGRMFLWLCVCPGVHARVHEVPRVGIHSHRVGQFKANLAQLPDVDKIAAIELTFHDTGEPCGMWGVSNRTGAYQR